MKFVIAGLEHVLDDQERILRELGHTIVGRTSILARAGELLSLPGYEAVLIAFHPDEAETLLKNSRPGDASIYVYVEAIDPGTWRRFVPYRAVLVTPGRERTIYPKAVAAREPETEISWVPEEVARADAEARAAKLEQKPPAQVLKNRILMTYSPKGGVGKTTFSVLSGYFLVRNGYKTVVVDLDHSRSGSDVGRKFGYFSISGRQPKRTVASFHNFPMRDYGSWETVKEYVHQAVPGLPLYYAAAPFSTQDAMLLTADLIDRTLAVLSHHFDVILIDTGDDLREHNVQALRLAQIVFFLVSYDIDVIDAAYQFVKHDVPALNLPLERFRLILTSVPEKKHFKELEIAEQIMLPLFGTLPEDPELRMTRMNRNLAQDAYLDTAYGKALQKIIRQIVPIAAEEKKSGLFNRLFRKKVIL